MSAFITRRLDGEPYVRANCAGGVAFGPGYSAAGTADLAQPDQFAWISGDSLCSVDGPCNNPAENRPGPGPQPQTAPAPQTASDQQSMESDDSEVHGLQGMPVGLLSQITPPPNANDQAAGVDQAYLIDLDINVDATGAVIPDTLLRDDSTKIGDVAIYQICGGAPSFALPPILIAHWPVFSHSRAGSHNPQYSHYRHGTHNPKLSHERARSHTRSMTHYRYMSGQQHEPKLSAHPVALSHNRELSIHRQPQSHNPRISSDLPVLSHNRKLSHLPEHSHNTRLTHLTAPSQVHDTRLTHRTVPSHDTKLTHRTIPSHNTELTHRREPSHNPQISNEHPPQRSHNPKISDHPPARSHNPKISDHPPARSHNARISDRKTPDSVDRKVNTHKPPGSHNKRISSRGEPKLKQERLLPRRQGIGIGGRSNSPGIGGGGLNR